MKLKEWTKEIEGTDDVELAIPRASPLIYHCTAPAEVNKMAGMVLLIPGFGEDVAGAYQQNLRAYLAEKYGLLAVTVEYHCSQSRLNTGAAFKLSKEEYDGLRNLCARHRIHFDRPEDIERALLQLNIPYEFDLHITPRNNDYQNFGVMQALDHLLVLHDIKFDKDVIFEHGNIIACGSSHGGYIAHVLAKFAPNTIRAVIDNSSYTNDAFFGAQPPYCYFGKIKINLHLVTRWELKDKLSPYYFSSACHAIRNTASKTHIASMHSAARRLCQYRMAHSALDDYLAPISLKREQTQLLADAGFDTTLKEFGEGEVDGKMIKSLKHGMDASLRDLFDYFYPTLTPIPATEYQSDSDLGSSVAYLCDNKIYSLEHGSYGCILNVAALPDLPPRTALKFY